MTPQWSGTAPFAETAAAASGGDERAFCDLWRWLHPGLLRYLELVAPWDCEDIASEVWYSIARDLPSFSGDERAFRAWAMTIARHRMIDSSRRRARRVETQPIVDLDLATEDDASARLTSQVELDDALAVVRTLPRAQADVIALRVVAGLSVAEAACVLGKSEGAVRVLAHRGLRYLAEQSAAPGEPLDDAHASPDALAPVSPPARAEAGAR